MDNRFDHYVAQLEKIVTEQGWGLTKHFRSRWCSSTPHDQREVAFGIMVGAEGKPTLYIKRVHAEAAAFPVKANNYREAWDEEEYLLEPGSTPLSTFIPLLQLAYQRSAKEREKGLTLVTFRRKQACGYDTPQLSIEHSQQGQQTWQTRSFSKSSCPHPATFKVSATTRKP